DTAAGGQSRGPTVLVAEGNTAEKSLVFTDRPAERDRDFLAVLLVKIVLHFEVPLAQIRGRVVEVDRSVFLEVDDDPARRRAVEGEAGDLELPEPIAEGAAAVGFLDSACQRALAPDAGAVGVGEARASERPRGEDERILGRQRIDGGGAQLEERLGDEVSARLDDRLAFQLALADRAVVQLDVVVRAHRMLL